MPWVLKTKNKNDFYSSQQLDNMITEKKLNTKKINTLE